MSLYVNIEKKLGDFNLKVEFDAGNQVLGILGASGCGKSVTLKCIAGIIKPDKGQIILDDRVLFDSQKHINLSPQKRNMGLLFQNYALFPNMNVRDNIRMGARHNKDKVDYIIEKMYLKGLEKLKPDKLSGGQKQRTALARILVGEPDILMLDEPFSALDDYLRWNVEMEVSDIIKEFGKTTLLVSHSRDEVYRMCHQICVIDKGKSSPAEKVKDMFENPHTLSACKISGCKNYSRIIKTGDTKVKALDWNVVLECNRTINDDIKYIGLRSHFIRISENTGDNIIECHIERIIEDVFTMVIMLKTPGNSLLRLEMDKEKWNNKMCVGDAIDVFAAPNDIILLKE